MTKSITLVMCLCSFVFNSCALVPHEVTVKPSVHNTPSSIGEGVVLALEVLDERDDTTVGKRGMHQDGADITVKNLIPALERVLRDGFAEKGINVVAAAETADAELEAKDMPCCRDGDDESRPVQRRGHFFPDPAISSLFGTLALPGLCCFLSPASVSRRIQSLADAQPPNRRPVLCRRHGLAVDVHLVDGDRLLELLQR